MQRCPRFFIDFRLQRCLERLVRIVRAQKIRVPNEEAFFVVVGVDKPARDPVRVVAADLARCWIEHVDSVNLQLDLTIARRQDLDVRFDPKAVVMANRAYG